MTNKETRIIIKYVNEQMFDGGKTMNTSQIISTVFETVLVGFAVWAVFHEDLFIAVEERIAAAFRRRRLKVVKGEHSKNMIY